jgi:hypothetical protein
MTYDPTPAEVDQWVHGVQHLIWRRTSRPLPETEWVSECWGGTPPAWALLAAERGEPGEEWCPQMVPAHRMRQDTPEDELAVLTSSALPEKNEP